MGKILTQEDKDFIIANYDGLGPAECAKRRGLADCTIRKLARKWNLPKSKWVIDHQKEKCRLLGLKSKKWAVPLEQFRTIEKKEVAYLLGLLWADGSLCKQSFPYGSYYVLACSLALHDFKDVKKVFESTGKWNYSVSKKRRNCVSMGRVQIGGAEVGELFNRFQFSTKDASPDYMVSQIPTKILPYFYRGLLDGDGCICLYGRRKCTVSIAGSETQNWSYLVSFLSSLGIPCHIYLKKTLTGMGSVVEICSNDGIMKFCEYIYDGYLKDSIGLKRKWKKFQEFKAQRQRVEREKRQRKRFFKLLSEKRRGLIEKYYPSLGPSFCAKELGIKYGYAKQLARTFGIKTEKIS